MENTPKGWVHILTTRDKILNDTDKALIEAAPAMLEVLKENLEALKNLTGRDCYDSGDSPCVCTACKTKDLIKHLTP